MVNDRIAENADWQDAMNQFRLRTYQDLEKIFKELEEINQIIRRKPREPIFTNKKSTVRL